MVITNLRHRFLRLSIFSVVHIFVRWFWKMKLETFFPYSSKFWFSFFFFEKLLLARRWLRAPWKKRKKRRRTYRKLFGSGKNCVKLCVYTYLFQSSFFSNKIFGRFVGRSDGRSIGWSVSRIVCAFSMFSSSPVAALVDDFAFAALRVFLSSQNYTTLLLMSAIFSLSCFCVYLISSKFFQDFDGNITISRPLSPVLNWHVLFLDKRHWWSNRWCRKLIKLCMRAFWF